jgi:hypothetical protein
MTPSAHCAAIAEETLEVTLAGFVQHEHRKPRAFLARYHSLKWAQGTSIGIALSSVSSISSLRNHIFSIETCPAPDGLLPIPANIWTSTK